MTEEEDEKLAPRAFMSYSHDSDEHKGWVLALATRLRSHGVQVILDQWDLALGKDLAQFMEQGLTSSEWVVVVCTARYNEKANNREGGAGRESQIISADMFERADLKDQVIPVLRDPDADPPTPTFLKGLLRADMRTSDVYDRSYSELLRRILDEPAVPKPELGRNPFSLSGHELFVPLEHRSDRYVQPAAEGRIAFPYENNSGELVLGTGDYTFTTKWSSCGPGSLYIYKDPSDIHSVALAAKPGGLDGVGDALKYDSSSRSRVASVGDVALFRNHNDYWLAVYVDGVTVRDRSDPDSIALLNGSYRILADRSSVFSPASSY